MIREELELRNWIQAQAWSDDITPRGKKSLSSLITALRRAIIEDCAKVAEVFPAKEYDVAIQFKIATAIRAKGR